MTSPVEAIRFFLQRHAALLDSCRKIYVGFSGGVDSTALVLGFLECGQPFTAVHFEHHLRGEASIADAEWCRDFCEKRGIPFLQANLDVPSNKLLGESTEAAARRLRLEAWRLVCTGQKCAIFLAHHADDMLENFFLRAARGANASGLTGLCETRNLDGLLLCRPFLPLRKFQLKNYLEDNGIHDWREDATNGDNLYRRNAIRNSMLPLWKDIFGNDEGLFHCLESLRIDAEALDTEAESLFRQLADHGGPSSLELLKTANDAVFPRLLRLWLAEKTAQGDVPLSRQTIDRVKQELAQFEGNGRRLVTLEGDILLEINRNGLDIACKPQPLATRRWNFREAPVCHLPEIGAMLSAEYDEIASNGEPLFSESFDAAAFTARDLTIRSWLPGDRMRPFGASFSKKLQDIFTDCHVSGAERLAYPVVLHDDEIIWIPGLKRAEFGRVSPTATAILKLSYHGDRP